MNEELIDPLREALERSPDNVPLRLQIAKLLGNHGHIDEAAAEYRQVLQYEPANEKAKLGLSLSFMQLGKISAALVIIEELIGSPNPPAAAFILHARLLIRCGELDRAAVQYRRGIGLDPAMADATLAEQLGVDADHDEADDDVVHGRVRLSAQPADDSSKSFTMERPCVDFSDVGGIESVKQQIRAKIIHPLQHADLYKAYGKSVGGGILMYGPPGCGKTHLARATAGEVKSAFMSIGIHDVLNMWLGQSEQQLHALFQQARSHKPCVLFFDEVDALGASRTDMRHSAGRQLINQFLAELDGAQHSNDGVLILAATNAPWHLDNAFRRPGRFDRVLFVPPPDEPARAEILRIHLKGKPCEPIAFEQVAAKTAGSSGADLKAVVDAAVETKLEEAMRTGTPVPLTTKDLIKAAKSVRPSTKEWFATARNYALYSNEGGTYDEILEYLKIK